MREIKETKEMNLFSRRAKGRGKKIGFVPTMGAMHEGHLSLVAEAKKRSDVVVASIFINPIQFGPQEDFAHYPRDLKRDKKLLKALEIDALFLPEKNKMFPNGFKTYVEVGELSKKMCGRSRTEHFRGVATVVVKLFNIVDPDLAFFGEKDYQQQLIIRQMVKDLNLPVEIVSLPTIRDYDGLAMSSRNAYLDDKERKSATLLYRALNTAKEEIEKGERDPKKITFRLRSLIGSEPSLRLEYVILADPETLEEVKRVKGKTLVALAAHIGKTRLVDNILVSS